MKPYYFENLEKIRTSLNDTQNKEIDKIQEFSNNLFKNYGPTLYVYFLLYDLGARVMSTPDHFRITQNLLDKIEKFAESSSLMMAEEDGDFIVHNKINIATKANLMILPVVSDTGFFSFEDLNLAFANGILLTALPLQFSSFDGFQSKPQRSFFHHDLEHGVAKFVKNKDRITSLKMFYNFASILYNKIDKNSFIDQFVYFLFIHENIQIQDPNPENPYVTNPQDINWMSPKSVSIPIMLKILENKIIPNERVKNFIKILEKHSIQTFFENYPHLDRTIPLKIDNFPDETMDNADRLWCLDNIFSKYNVLFDYQEILQDYGFRVWTEDSHFNSDGNDGMISIWDALIADFWQKYEDVFFIDIDASELPKDFLPLLYIDFYPDLTKIMMGKSEEQKVKFSKWHYLKYGKNEGRHYKFNLPQDFDVKQYFVLNPDLQKASKTMSITEQIAWGEQHYLEHGRNEGRHYKFNLPQDFDVKQYFALNPDLQKALKTISIAEQIAWGERHYLEHGRNEGRHYK